MSDDGAMSVFAKFGLDVTDFLGGLEKSQSGILAFYRDVSVSIGATMFVFDKLMAYGQQFVELANKASEFVSTIDKLSVTTGLNNDELQRWSNVARYADSDISSLSSSLRKLQLNLNSSGDEGKKAREILDSMGVSYRNADGSLKSMTELFPDAIAGLSNLSSSADRVTASNALFGRSYQELAGYMTMSKAEMEGYYQSANVLTEEQQQKLRDYEQACKDLNSTLQGLSNTAGSDLAPSMREWTDLLNNEILEQGGSVDTFFSMLNGFLTDAARGFHIIGVEAGAAWKLAHGDIQGAIQDQKDLAAWVQSKQTQDALAATGYREGMVWDAASGKWVQAKSGSGTKLQISESSAGSSKTATPATQVDTSTYNSVFAASLQDGGVGPDAAGYSDLANMTTEQLQAVVAKGSAGGSKSMAEKAQMYLSLMKSASGTTSATSAGGAKTATPGSSEQTASLKTELEKQTDLWRTQNTNITDGWVTLEKSALTHYTALSELSRVRAQAELDYMAQCVNFAGEHPIIQNKIIMSKNGPDWEPPAFTAISAPTLKAADFSGVNLLGASQKKSESGSGSGSGSDGKTIIQITNERGIDTSVIKQESGAQASQIILGGGTAG